MIREKLEDGVLGDEGFDMALWKEVTAVEFTLVETSRNVIAEAWLFVDVVIVRVGRRSRAVRVVIIVEGGRPVGLQIQASFVAALC